MRFKLDENLPVEAADLLREAGHDAATVLDQGLGGERDPDVAGACRRERRVLVTFDTDFADIRAYPPEDHTGLLVFRLRRQDKRRLLDVLRRTLLLLEDETLEGQLWVV